MPRRFFGAGSMPFGCARRPPGRSTFRHFSSASPPASARMASTPSGAKRRARSSMSMRLPSMTYNWGNPTGGFYAEYIAVPADKVASIQKQLDLRHAGAIPITGLTALQGVDDALNLKKGETIIIHGASGGVGTLAVQFAKLRGARVFATASGQEGVELVREMGAHVRNRPHRRLSAAAPAIRRRRRFRNSHSRAPAENGACGAHKDLPGRRHPTGRQS